jgi:HK97 family phage prohead protease
MADDLMRFDTVQSAVFEVNAESRTIKGLVLPYGVVGNNGEGKYTFARGTIVTPTDLSRVKLLISHDFSQAVGYATDLEDTEAGVVGTFKVARGAEGDRALSMAQDKVWDGLSAGIGRKAKFTAGRDGVFSAISADIAEVSLTPLPAFEDARVTSVAASAVPSQKEVAVSDKQEPVEIEAPVSLTAADITKAVQDGMTSAFTNFDAKIPVQAGLPVGPVFVNEAAPYRFDGMRGTHDFSTDLISGLGLGGRTADGEAYERVLKFMGEALGPKFVTTTDTAAINPTGYRADMFVNEQQFKTPLYDALYKGALTDVTPFSFAKFNTGTGLVADHVQGTEPTNGTYTTASAATVTPAPVSGKVHITREVADQGGNPQVSALIWGKIVYEYRKAMETKVATMLDASAAAELGAAIAQGANTVAGLATPLEQAIAGLNFIAGGDRFNYAATHIDLYLALAALKDGQNRPYFPIINPANATGTASGGYKSLNVAGTRFDPVWSLGGTSSGAAPAEKSYLIDTSSVWFWASAPTKLDRLQEKVEGYDLGVWGYWAGVISDITGVRKISYDLA